MSADLQPGGNTDNQPGVPQGSGSASGGRSCLLEDLAVVVGLLLLWPIAVLRWPGEEWVAVLCIDLIVMVFVLARRIRRLRAIADACDRRQESVDR